MADKNLSVTLFSNGELKLVERPIPEPAEGEVQIRIEDVGICGTDVQMWRHLGFGDLKVTEPVVLGHEASGVVSKLGPGVTTLKVGDRVSIEPNVPCFHCRQCTSGHYNMCPDIRLTSVPEGQQGSFARYRVQAVPMVHKMPDQMSFEEGAILEPLSVAVHAMERVQLSLGEKVLICGGGRIGILTLMVAKACGASQICVTDVDQRRLDIAKKFGADFTVLADSKDSKVIAGKVQEVMGSPADVSFDCVGLAATQNTAIYGTRNGGRVGLIGLATSLRESDIMDVICREISLIGIMTFVNNFPTAMALVTSGKINVSAFVTHRIPLEDALTAFDLAEKGEGLKIIIKCGRK